MQFVNQLEEVKQSIISSQLALLFIKTSNCAVCESVYPKTVEMLSSYPSVHGVAVSMEEVPKAAGEYLAFAAPTIILFVEGKEVYRQSRFIIMNDLEHHVNQWAPSDRIINVLSAEYIVNADIFFSCLYTPIGNKS